MFPFDNDAPTSLLIVEAVLINSFPTVPCPPLVWLRAHGGFLTFVHCHRGLSLCPSREGWQAMARILGSLERETCKTVPDMLSLLHSKGVKE